MKHFAILYEIEDEKSEEFEKSLRSDKRIRMYYSDDEVDKEGHSYLLRAFKNEI